MPWLAWVGEKGRTWPPKLGTEVMEFGGSSLMVRDTERGRVVSSPSPSSKDRSEAEMHAGTEEA